MMMFLSSVNVSFAGSHTYRSTRFPKRGTLEILLVSPPVLLWVQYRYTPWLCVKPCCNAMPNSPRSDAEFTARSSAVPTTLPPTTCRTLPVAFSRTRKSFGPRNTMLVGWSRPVTTVVTWRFRSTMDGPSGGGTDDGFTVSVPKRPCCSFPIPAVKNSVLEEDCATPKPKPNAHRPGIVIGLLFASLTLPRKFPESKSNTLIAPSPELPTNSALSNLPKPSNGAQAIPQGELSWPWLVNRFTRFPSVSKMSMNPWPAPATSSFFCASCNAQDTYSLALIEAMPNGA